MALAGYREDATDERQMLAACVVRLPLVIIAPANNPVYSPGGTGPSPFHMTTLVERARIGRTERDDRRLG